MWRWFASFCLLILAMGLRTRSQAVPPTPVKTPAASLVSAGVRIHFEDGGSGPGLPVIFVHGLAGDLEMWRHQLDPLRRTRRAVALDLRGHGLSGQAATGEYSMPAMASDVLAVANGLGIQRFVLVGHSLGGAVILAVSQAAPQRVAGLFFVDPAGDVSRLPKERLDAMLEKMAPATYLDFMKGWFGVNLEHGKEATRTRVLSDVEKTPQAVVRAAYLGLAAFEPVPALRSFKGPMLTVILPGSDRPSSYQNLVPDLPAVKVKDLSHWLMMDDPEGVNAILDGFLRTADLAATRRGVKSKNI